MISHQLNKSHKFLVIKIQFISDSWFTIEKNNNFIEDIAQEQIDDLKSDNSNVYALIKKRGYTKCWNSRLGILKIF